MKKKPEGVWMMELDRFGYTLRVAAKTEEECVDAMKDEYIVTYAKYNEMDVVDLLHALTAPPVLNEDGEVDEYDPLNEFMEYYRNAFEDCEARFYEYGKVEWE